MTLVNNVCLLVIVVTTLAGIYIAIQFNGLRRLSEGTEAMSKLAARIRSGSNVFNKTIFRVILIVAVIIAGLIGFIVEPWAGAWFIAAVLFTTISILVGNSVATYTNVRATAAARQSVLDGVGEEEGCARTVNVTIKGSQICGIIVHSSGALGLALVVLISGFTAFFIPEGKLVVPISARLTAYSLGWSLVALFCRVAGGLFTKAADMGADLIGKVFMHFKEDDPRNPAVLADLVGDNVNDIDGNQADLGESFVATPVAVIITAVSMYGGNMDDTAMLSVAVAYPFILILGGLISSIIGLFIASHAKKSKNPGVQLNTSLYIAVTGTMMTSLLGSYFLFGRTGLVPAEFRFGWISLFFSAFAGIGAGVVVGLIAQHFTDLDSVWAKRVAKMAQNGAALCCSEAQAAGFISCFFEILVVMGCSYAASYIAGPYGRATMALSMLSFIAQPIAADAFGPISDNAGGIAESCELGENGEEDEELSEKTRVITDKNDAKGNSTAAVGKAFAICGAAAVVQTQVKTYQMAYGGKVLDISKDEVTFGLGIGVALMWLFVGLLTVFCIKGADLMAGECKRQLSLPEVIMRKAEPDSNACIKIATLTGIKHMIVPVLIDIGSTLAVGFTFGAECLGGTQVGVLYSGLPLAIYFSNCGGLADNAKKRYEANKVKGFEKGTEGYNYAHDAAVQGDTMGDWMKDVDSVSIDIFMKIMGTTALMLAPLFAEYHLLPI